MNDSRLTIKVLGSGTSHGIPMIACDCAVCTSPDPKDRRSRPCIAVEYGETTLLIDTGPEIRLQCIDCQVNRIAAVLYTHFHIDHIAGLDDLRRFNWVQNQSIPCYAQAATLDRLQQMFPYAFNTEPGNYAVPQLDLHRIDGPFEVGGKTVTPLRLLHGDLEVLGFRIDNFAYCTDVSKIPDETWPLLEGLDVLILDALRKRPHPKHFNLEQAVEHAHRIAAGQTFFTHIAHELPHAETNRELPERMALSYDGQVIHV